MPRSSGKPPGDQSGTTRVAWTTCHGPGHRFGAIYQLLHFCLQSQLIMKLINKLNFEMKFEITFVKH